MAITIRCFSCGKGHPPDALNTTCSACGMPLRVEVDLSPAPAERIIRTSLPSMWRYGRLLPVPWESAVTLVEGWTPLLELEPGVWLKDEARNPTGSFKARGMSMAVSAAKLRGAERLVAPSAGNAAGALAAYGAAAGLPILVAMPADTPPAFLAECRHYGAEVELVEGTIADAGRWLADHRAPTDFDVSTLREPFRIEGKKTMGYELHEQLGGRLPDVVVYPTGGGTGLVGMWKAWGEMERLGWIGSERPRLVSVQAEGCAPVVSAFRRGDLATSPWTEPVTGAYGLRVPDPLGGFLCLRALRETGGTAVAVPEEEIHATARRLAARSGVDVCPEAGAAWWGMESLRRAGWIEDGERVVVFNTGTGSKYR